MIRRGTIVAAVAAVSVLAVGCSSGNGGATSVDTVASKTLPPELSHITIAAVPVTDDAGLYVAQDQGLFKAAGLTVTIDPVISSAAVAAGMDRGTYAISAGNSVSYIQDQTSHAANLEIVAEGSLMQPGNEGLYTVAGSTISGISALRGKRIGVNSLNSIGTVLIDSLLQSYGVQPDSVRFVQVPQGFAGMAAALQRDTIDVAWLPEPYGSMDEVTYGLQELTDLDQGANTDFPVAWYVATKAWAKKYPRTLAAFLSALQEGQRMADTSRVYVERAMEELPEPYTVPASLAPVMSVEEYPVNVAPDIDLSTVQQVADLMYQVKMLKTPFQVSSMLTSG